jgi:hypothetical protein
VRRKICVYGCCCLTEPTMSRRIVDLNETRNPPAATRLSRRDFLGTVGRMGSILPVSSLLPKLPLMQALQKPTTSTTKRHAATNPLPAAGFSFKEITKESGLTTAVNVFGGVARKEYILEETGCGVACSTTTRTDG